MNRIISREIETGADETLLVLDATTGQMLLFRRNNSVRRLTLQGSS